MSSDKRTDTSQDTYSSQVDVGSELADRLASGAPSESGAKMVEREADRRLEQRAEWGQLEDKFGRRFDPELHHHDDITGEPEITKAGTLRIRRKGMKLGRQHTTPRAQSTLAAPAAPELNARDVAIVTVDSLTGICSMLFGEHWKAEDTEQRPEYSTMVEAWTRYFRAEGITKIDPKWFLGLTMGGYFAPRLAHEKTRSRVKGWFRTRQSRFEKWREKRREREAAERGAEASQARHADRADGLGEDNTGGQTGERILESPHPYYRS